MTSSSRRIRIEPRAGNGSELAVALAATGYWAVQDVEMTISTFAEDIIYQLYACRSARVIVIERCGRESVRDMLYDVLADFDYDSCQYDILQADNGVVRVQSRYVMRHRASGEVLAGSKRFVCAVKNGLFTRVHEYTDAALVEAFFKLAKWRLQEDGSSASIRTHWPLHKTMPGRGR